MSRLDQLANMEKRGDSGAAGKGKGGADGKEGEAAQDEDEVIEEQEEEEFDDEDDYVQVGRMMLLIETDREVVQIRCFLQTAM
jgi:hypothetical protein